MNTNLHFKSWGGRATGSGTEIKAVLCCAWDGQRVVIICFSAPLHLKDEAGAGEKSGEGRAGGERDGK